jgi:uncharacterized protein YqgV (UPF0045/DUF77 family)
MEPNVHISFQIIPKSSNHHPYHLVDKALEVIQASGVRHEVTAMETVMEGTYPRLMALIDQCRIACLEAGADEVIMIIKTHERKGEDLRFEEKTEKYRK